MVGRAPSDAGAFFLLAQDGAQASSDKAVEDAEQGWCGMLEGAKPPAKQRVEVIDDPFQAIASAAARHAPHLVPRFRRGQARERLQAPLAHQPATRLEPVAEEIEPLP